MHLGAQVCGAGFETEGSFGVTTFFYEGFDILTLVLFAYTQCSHVREALNLLYGHSLGFSVLIFLCQFHTCASIRLIQSVILHAFISATQF